MFSFVTRSSSLYLFVCSYNFWETDVISDDPQMATLEMFWNIELSRKPVED